MEKNQFLSGFAAFGGGRYQCPGRYSAHSVGVASWLILWVWLLGLFCGCGFLAHSVGVTSCMSVVSLPLSCSRWYALMEIQLFTAVVLRTFDMELMDPLPTVVSSLLVCCSALGRNVD